MKIDIICVGNLKEKYLKDAVEEYKKRITAYATVSIVEIKEERLPSNPSQAEIDKALEIEGEKIFKAINGTSSMISLCIEGKEVNSETLAKSVARWMREGGSRISFIIGSSYGLSKEVKEKSHRLSFSKLTFPHQIMRLILMEQIYRSFKILKNEPYHK